MKYISENKKIDFFKPLIYGGATFFLSMCIFAVIYMLHGINEDQSVESRIYVIIFGIVLLGPMIETCILMIFILAAKNFQIKPIFCIPFIALLSMLLHIPAKDDLYFLPIQFFSFTVFSWYIYMRRGYANKKVCWLEGTVMHSFFNLLSVALLLLEF